MSSAFVRIPSLDGNNNLLARLLMPHPANDMFQIGQPRYNSLKDLLDEFLCFLIILLGLLKKEWCGSGVACSKAMILHQQSPCSESWVPTLQLPSRTASYIILLPLTCSLKSPHRHYLSNEIQGSFCSSCSFWTGGGFLLAKQPMAR